ncbi:hypothetical protein ACI65C_013259 [Semiaphis heraclei]
MSHYGFTSFVNSPTRVWDGGESCIDHIFIKTITNFSIDNAVILESTITDHFPTFIQIIPNTISKNKTEKAYNNSTRKSIFKIKPWITTEILNSIIERDILHAQSRKKPYDLQLKEKFKKCRNYLNSAIKKAKFDFYGDKIKKCNNNPKLIWKTIKEATQGHPNTNIKTLHIDINNTTYTNKTQPFKIAEHFHECFANITSKNENNYINTTEISVDNIDPSLPLQSLYIRKTNLTKRIRNYGKIRQATSYNMDLLQQVLSEKGKPLLIINEFKFRKIGKSKDGIKWRCTVKSCTSSVCSDESVTTLLTSNLNHNHEKSSNINRQIVANSLKRKAIDQITTRPLKLIRNEVQSSAVDLTLNDIT